MLAGIRFKTIYWSNLVKFFGNIGLSAEPFIWCPNPTYFLDDFILKISHYYLKYTKDQVHGLLKSISLDQNDSNFVINKLI